MTLKEFFQSTDSAANKYYSSAGYHEQIKPWTDQTADQIIFLAATIKQRRKLVLNHSLCKNEFTVLVQVSSTVFPVKSNNE